MGDGLCKSNYYISWYNSINFVYWFYCWIRLFIKFHFYLVSSEPSSSLFPFCPLVFQVKPHILRKFLLTVYPGDQTVYSFIGLFPLYNCSIWRLHLIVVQVRWRIAIAGRVLNNSCSRDFTCFIVTPFICNVCLYLIYQSFIDAQDEINY